MDAGTIFFLSLTAFVGAGAVWFRIVRPLLTPADDGPVTSSAASVPAAAPREPEPRSYATEPDRELPGTQAQEPVPDMVPVAELPELLAQLDDETLVELLALVPGDKDGYRFADSTIAKFVPGRTADWLPLIRTLREKPAPAPPRTPYAGREYDPSRYRAA